MINPLTWSREHQLGLLVAALIGAALGAVLGGAIIYVRCLLHAPAPSPASRVPAMRSAKPVPEWPSQDRGLDRAQDRPHDWPQERSPRLPRSR
jgi:hypothetical protein